MDLKRLEAAKEGKKQYEGRECRKCGNTVRYVVSDGCVACLKENTYRHRNKVREELQKARESAVT